MNNFLQSIFTFTLLTLFTITINSQTTQQTEVGNFIAKEYGVEIRLTREGENLFFKHNENSYLVYLDEKHIRIEPFSGSPHILLDKMSNSELEKTVFQLFKDIANQVNQSFYTTKSYWYYREKYDVFQLGSIISTSLPIDEAKSWKLNFNNALISTEKCKNLFVEKYVTSITNLAWPISQNETDPNILNEAIFWAQEAIKLKPDADRTFVYASLLFKSGQTLLALEKVNETIELCKKEGQNYDLSSTLKEKLESIVNKDEGGLYNMKKEGQEWQIDNLRTIYFRNGDEIFHAKTDEEWKDAAEKGIPAWCYYNNDKTYGFKLGKLYNWYAVNDPRGLAPNGWHIPSLEEWQVLIDYFGKDTIGKYLKSKNNWKSEYGSNGNGDNYQSFNALPGGSRNYKGYYNNTDFYSIGTNGNWWTTKEEDSEEAHVFKLSADTQASSTFSSSKGRGYSVRCIKD